MEDLRLILHLEMLRFGIFELHTGFRLLGELALGLVLVDGGDKWGLEFAVLEAGPLFETPGDDVILRLGDLRLR